MSTNIEETRIAILSVADLKPGDKFTDLDGAYMTVLDGGDSFMAIDEQHAVWEYEDDAVAIVLRRPVVREAFTAQLRRGEPVEIVELADRVRPGRSCEGAVGATGRVSCCLGDEVVVDLDVPLMNGRRSVRCAAVRKI